MNRSVLSSCLGMLLCCGTLFAETSWPQWRGANRDGKSTEKGINTDWEAKKPNLLWIAEGFGGGYASVSIAGDKLFTSGNFDDGQAILCFDLKTQKEVWKKPITEKPPKHGYEGSRTTPTIDGDRLYAVSSAGDIVCLKQADGEILWSKNFGKEWKGKMHSGWGFSESPLVDGDRVLCTPGGPEAMIVALNKMTGEEIWKTAMPAIGSKGGDGAAYSSIVISHAAGEKQYVQLVGRGVIGVSAADGKFLWGYNPVANGTANIPTPLVDGDHVFASTGYGTGSALLKIVKTGSAFNAEERYFLKADTLQNHHGGMVLVDGHIYCGHAHNQGFPICVNMKEGKVVWGGDQRGVGKGSAAVLYVDGHLIFRYQDGKVALVQATTEGYKLKGSFTPEFQQKESWSHPVVVDKKLYLREQNKLMCYDLAE